MHASLLMVFTNLNTHHHLKALLIPLLPQGLYKVGSNKEAIMIPIEIQGQSLLMDIDTGASISIMLLETYQKHSSNIPLVQSSATLHTYNGGIIPVCGQFSADVHYTASHTSSYSGQWLWTIITWS